MDILKDFNPADLQDLERINALCLKQHVMPPATLKLKAEVIMGGEVVALYQDLARSWVRNNYNFMTMQQMGIGFGTPSTTYGAGAMVMRRTTGTDDNADRFCASSRVDRNTNSYHFRAEAGITTHGIVVGTGTTAESFEHHNIATLIANGAGAGQMDYAAMDALTATWDGGTKKFTQEVVRFINNNSGGSITVNEAGLICILYTQTGTTGTTYYYLLARDLLSPGVAVPATAQLKVTYTIESATYP